MKQQLYFFIVGSLNDRGSSDFKLRLFHTNMVSNFTANEMICVDRHYHLKHTNKQTNKRTDTQTPNLTLANERALCWLASQLAEYL